MKRIIASVLVGVLFSGCLTPRVWNKGLHQRTAKGEIVYVAADQSIAIEARVNTLKGSFAQYFVRDIRSLGPSLRKANLLPTDYKVIDIHVGEAGTSGWQEIPSEASQRDAIPEDLPEKFRARISTFAYSEVVTLVVDGEAQQLRFGQLRGLKQDRDPKAVPQLALLVPAVIGDAVIGVVMLPFVALGGLVLGFAALYSKLTGKPLQ